MLIVYSLFVGFAIFLNCGAFLFLIRKKDTLTGQLAEAQATADDMYQEALIATQLKVKAETELTFLQNTVMQLMNRQVLATMSDVQMQNITAALISYVESVRSPEKMN